MRELFVRSMAALLIILPLFGCISDDEHDMASTKCFVFSSEHTSKIGDLEQNDPLRAAPRRVWETAAGELTFDSGETFSTMTTQRQERTDNNRLEGKAVTTDKNKKINAK